MAYKNNQKNGKGTQNFRDRGKKNYNDKRGQSGTRDQDYVSKRSADNDVSWYANSPQLLKDTCSLAFPNAIGLPLEAAHIHVGGSVVLTEEVTPGVAALHWLPSVGSTANRAPQAAGINVAARNMYSYVRHANSGSRNYEAADLMTYIIAADSLYYLIAHAVRAYGVSRTYSVTNRYYSNTVLKAMGFDPDSIYGDLAKFRSNINLLIYKLKQLAVPAKYSYFKRHVWLCSNLYMDRTNNKSQTYVYVPEGYYEWSGTAYETGSALLLRELTKIRDGQLYTVDEYYEIVNSLLEKYLANEDVGIMSGDILKAFGEGELVTMNEIPENYAITPVHNAEVLRQMHNTIFIGGTLSGSTADVTQENGYLKSEIVRQEPYGNQLMPTDDIAMIDIDSPSPTPDDVMIATRNIAVLERINDSNAYITATGSEYFTQMRVYTEPDGTNIKFVTHQVLDAENLAEPSYASQVLKYAADYSRFDWLPRVHTILIADDVAEPIDCGFIWETDNLTSVNTDVISQIHDIAIMSQLTW